MKRRITKKRMRKVESRLSLALRQYITKPKQLTENENHKEILSIRWGIYDLLYYHLKLDPDWSKRNWFLELLDIESLEINQEPRTLISIAGKYDWWAEGKDAEAAVWWPDDRVPNVTKHGVRYMTEPFTARIWLQKDQENRLRYKFEFGADSTYRLFTNYPRNTVSW
jgi:hypothetical protein